MLWVPQQLFLRTGPRDKSSVLLWPVTCQVLDTKHDSTCQASAARDQSLTFKCMHRRTIPHSAWARSQWNCECLKESGPKTRACRDRKKRFAVRSKLV